MKNINIIFEDKEYKNLVKLKGKLSWHDYILLLWTHCFDAQKKGDFNVIE